MRIIRHLGLFPSLPIIFRYPHESKVQHQSGHRQRSPKIQRRSITLHFPRTICQQLHLDRPGKAQPQTIPIQVQRPNQAARNALIAAPNAITRNDLRGHVHEVRTDAADQDRRERLLPVELLRGHRGDQQRRRQARQHADGHDALRLQARDQPRRQPDRARRPDAERDPADREVQHAPAAQQLLPRHHVPQADAEGHVRQQHDEDERGEGRRREDGERHDGRAREPAFPDEEAGEGEDGEGEDDGDVGRLPADRGGLAVEGLLVCGDARG